jgi:hypothetical protein
MNVNSCGFSLRLPWPKRNQLADAAGPPRALARAETYGSISASPVVPPAAANRFLRAIVCVG